MRILICLNYFYPYISGVSEYARAMAAVLSEVHDVTVLTGKHLPELPDEEEVDGYRIVRAPILFRLDKGYIAPKLVSKFRQLSRNADVVNLHYPMLEAGLLARLTKAPVLMTYQCDMAYEGSLLSRLAVWGVRRSGASALKRADQVATLSLDYAQSSPFLQPYLSKVCEVHPPNRFECEALGAHQTLSEEPGFLDPSEYCIGFVGRFVKEKGIDVLLDAIGLLDELPVKLSLVGDFDTVAGGSVFKDLKSKIDRLGPRVRVLGKLNDAALLDFYKNIDVVALPSVNRFEAFGMVQMEAMGFGAIPVASDLPGVRSTIRATGTGFIADVGDAASLADAFRAAYQQRQTLSRKAVSDRLFAVKKHTFRDQYTALLDLTRRAN